MSDDLYGILDKNTFYPEFMGQNRGDGMYMRNIWGWKWSIISLIIICLFLGIAVCRYIMIKPDHLINPDQTEQDF